MNAHFNYLSHLACSVCGYQYQADQLQTISPCCSRPLLVQYDLPAIAHSVTREKVAQRTATMWRYHELLPVQEEQHVLTLGEGMTPLLAAPRLAPQGLEDRAVLL